MATRGRKPFFETPEEMQAAIDKYFDDCAGETLTAHESPVTDKNGIPIIIGAHPPTITGLALALGFTSRQALLNYQGKKKFVDTITRAKLRVEQYTEERLFDRDGQRGAEFSLTHNFRWLKDRADEDSECGILEIGAAKGKLTPPEEQDVPDEETSDDS